VKAVFALARFAGLEVPFEKGSDSHDTCLSRVPVEIDIEKKTPAAAGLGGGSADAAAVLVGLNRLWNLGLGTKELQAIGEELGADVPFCITGGTGIIRGKGERIESLPTPHNLWFVVVTLTNEISTAEAYTTFDRLSPDVPVYEPGFYGKGFDTTDDTNDVTSRMVHALKDGKVHDIARSLTNDLERAAVTLVPSITKVKEMLLAVGQSELGCQGAALRYSVLLIAGKVLKGSVVYLGHPYLSSRGRHPRNAYLAVLLLRKYLCAKRCQKGLVLSGQRIQKSNKTRFLLDKNHLQQ
jgi:hypothetical protein